MLDALRVSFSSYLMGEAVSMDRGARGEEGERKD